MKSKNLPAASEPTVVRSKEILITSFSAQIQILFFTFSSSEKSQRGSATVEPLVVIFLPANCLLSFMCIVLKAQ